jgi:hypothetical protein
VGTRKFDTFGLINGELMVVDYRWLYPSNADKLAKQVAAYHSDEFR